MIRYTGTRDQRTANSPLCCKGRYPVTLVRLRFGAVSIHNNFWHYLDDLLSLPSVTTISCTVGCHIACTAFQIQNR